MPRIHINGQALEVQSGTTVWQAAADAGIEIPALCHVAGVRPLTACMVCVVEDTATGRSFPSCATAAEDGMVIETENDAIRAARKEVLQLLLSEHVGDCEAPCRRICPASLDVPLMMRKVAAGDEAGASRLAYDALLLPETLGWVCSAPCERGCHRGVYDEPLLIRETHRRLAEGGFARVSAELARPTGKRVAVAGAGIAGLCVAWTLQCAGHACRLFEKADRPGGALRDLSEAELPRDVLDAEIAAILATGIELACNCEVGTELALADLLADYDAVVIACEGLDDERDEEPSHLFTALELPMAVSSVAEGRRAGHEAGAYLRDMPAPGRGRAFDCRLGEIREEEKAVFAQDRVADVGEGRRYHASRDEAKRCLHCDCLKTVSCKLRRYATRYGAKQSAYAGAGRPPIEPLRRGDGVLFEPGKCIRCGLCVEIAERYAEPLGLTFIGRGFNVHVGVPFDHALEDGLSRCAHECASACPTGALSLRGNEEREG